MIRKRLSLGLVIFLLLFHIPPPLLFASDSDIVINEFQVDPSSSSQWVELYNKGTDMIDLTDWTIDDNGGTQIYTISSGILTAQQCISFQSSDFNFNTSTSDIVRLFHNGNLIDSHTYEKSPGTNMSIGRLPDGTDNWTSFSNPSRDRSNADASICAGPTPTPTPTDAPTPTRTPTPTKTPTPTRIPTPTKTPTPKPGEPTNTKSTVANVLGTNIKATPTTDYAIPTSVLGTETKKEWPTIVPTKTITQIKTLAAHGINPAIIFIVLGSVLLLGVGGYCYYSYRKGR